MIPLLFAQRAKKKQSKYTPMEKFGVLYIGGTIRAENPSLVKCRKIGVADESIEKGVVLASFNAG